MKNIFKNLIVVLFSTLFTTAVCAQSYPIKTIKIVVPFPPGGATDIIARAVAEKLQLAFNKPVIVENKAGGKREHRCWRCCAISARRLYACDGCGTNAYDQSSVVFQPDFCAPERSCSNYCSCVGTQCVSRG